MKNGDSGNRGCYKLATYVPDNSADITLTYVYGNFGQLDGCAIRLGFLAVFRNTISIAGPIFLFNPLADVYPEHDSSLGEQLMVPSRIFGGAICGGKMEMGTMRVWKLLGRI